MNEQLQLAVQKSYEANMRALGATKMKIDVIGPSTWWIEMKEHLRESIAGNRAEAKEHGFELCNEFAKEINEEGRKYLEFED